MIFAPEIKWISFDWRAIFNTLPKLHFSHKITGFCTKSWILFLYAQASLGPTPVSPFVRHIFGFPFCQHLWALTKHLKKILNIHLSYQFPFSFFGVLSVLLARLLFLPDSMVSAYKNSSTCLSSLFGDIAASSDTKDFQNLIYEG